MIPEQLTARDQWVIWRYEQIEGEPKPRKIPYTSAFPYRKADTTKPLSWGPYAAAVRVAGKPQFEVGGIGYVFSKDDPYAGIDLDHCVAEDDGTITPFAQGMLEQFPSYAEWSPSHTGIHILVEATIPRGRKTTKVEVYSSGRYFTVTGEQLEGSSDTIQPCQEAMDSLFATVLYEEPAHTPDVSNIHGVGPDGAIVSLIQHSTQGGKYRRLAIDGDITDYGSSSEADLALCSILAFWTRRNAEQMDRMFRQSALYRPKWDQRRGERTYGQITVDKAVAGTTEVYGAANVKGVISWSSTNGSTPLIQVETAETSKFRIIPSEELLRQPDPTWLVDGMIPSPGVGMIYASSGIGKSFVMLDLACSVATGREWMGRTVAQGDVLYVAAEGAMGFKRRLRAWQETFRLATERLHWLCDAPQLMDPDEIGQVLAAVRISGINPSLIVVDTLTRTMVGGDENGVKDMGRFLAGIEYLGRETGATVMIVHHAGHGEKDRPRGSSAIMGAVDTLIALVGDKGDGPRTIYCEKQKDSEEFEPLAFELAVSHDSLVVREGQLGPESQVSRVAQRLLSVLQDMQPEGANTTQWMDATPDIPKRTWYRARTELLAHSLVINEGSQTRTSWVSAISANVVPTGLALTPSGCAISANVVPNRLALTDEDLEV